MYKLLFLLEIFYFSGSSANASKEILPPEPAPPGALKNTPLKQQSSNKLSKEKQDDFSDLIDYVLLDSAEKEKHRVEIDRVHPVIEKKVEGRLLKLGNPTIADMKKISIR